MDIEDRGTPEGADANLLPYLLHRASSLMSRVWLEDLRAHGITVARWQVLSILHQFDGARIGQLADLAGAEQSVTTRVVDQMERDGLVQRRAARADARGTEVWLTRQGRRVFATLLPDAERMVREALHGLDEQTIAVVSRALMTVAGNLERR